MLTDPELHERPGTFRLIPTAWLRQWALGIKDDLPILNTSGGVSAVDTERNETTVSTGQSESVISRSSVNDGRVQNGETSSKMEVINVVDSSDDEMRLEARLENGEVEEICENEGISVQDLFEEPLSIAPYVCSHGTSALNPLKVREFKFVSETAYSTLISVLKGPIDIELSRLNALCAICCDEVSRGIEKDRARAEIDDDILSVLENDLGAEATETSRRISKEWVSSFKKSSEQRRRMLDFKEQALDASLVPSYDGKKMTDFWLKEGLTTSDDGDINRSLICQHTDIKTDFKKKSIAVSVADWDLITKKYNESTVILNGSQVCVKCACVSRETQELKQLQKDERLIETSTKCMQDLYVRKQAFSNEISDIISLINAETGSMRRKVKTLIQQNGEARYLYIFTRIVFEILKECNFRMVFFLITSSWIQSWREYIDNNTLNRPGILLMQLRSSPERSLLFYV